ncbi:hypothetical protein T05_6247 [Trichinella murrelli]|uniref:Uncharacterized protein n=1 Tax=Trichinella murrelli TaxID=144512 RepID=A0A0V0U7Z5_9BILA|nr:hypothetical protein T05_6247 [Trichinella murrelli]
MSCRLNAVDRPLRALFRYWFLNVGYLNKRCLPCGKWPAFKALNGLCCTVAAD